MILINAKPFDQFYSNNLKAISLKGDDIHIWSASIPKSDFDISNLEQILSGDEIERANRFRFRKHKNQFVITRNLLRKILALYLKSNPKEILFEYSQFEKPYLANIHNKTQIYFNASHSHNIVLFAFALNRSVGVDVEYVRLDFNHDEIARRFFSDDEVEEFLSVPEESRPEAFYNCWTRKEAFIKAIGEGLSYPLKDFDVTLKPGEPASILKIKGSRKEAARWTLKEIEGIPGYKTALAARAKNLEIIVRELNLSDLKH